ncbi:NDR1/HIN1-like protein 12 [Prosopis cineraria]|uniref:NDR1/HIN1-like protein 12 n=1 Tax=Prosopis cineraria TaxID=364024 RepID=UPI0024100CF2|nr:NDR1/HIN1-like protein 12 [Prosopis cineraria]
MPPNPMSKKRLHQGSHDRTHLLVWLAAILCTVFAIAVIVAGIAAFIGYILIHPRIPTLSVSSAHLDLLRNDLAGLLQTQVTVLIRAQNGNGKAHASFSDIKFKLSYQGQGIAVLRSDPINVAKNSSRYLNYVVQSSSIPLTPEQMADVTNSWQRNLIGFDLKGNARTQWRIGRLGSVKFWCHLECMLKFHPLNGSYIPSRCTTESK